MPNVIVTARLWVKDAHFAHFAHFEAFEVRAFQIMARHGAEIVRIEQDHAQVLRDGPHETHVLRFPSREAFDAYRVDPELLEMSNLRAACILRTEVSLHQE
jgi:uncharacterized protein (DUF1330 family)